ncbi:MAG: LptA/OstA family protein [Terriglobia bacterium]
MLKKKTPLELQEKRYGGRRKSIKRLLGLILFITLTAVFLGVLASTRRRGRVTNSRAELPANVSRQHSGVTVTHSEGGRQIFTIHAARTRSYQGARTVLEGVHVVIYGRTGARHDEITTDRCQYDNKTGALSCAGKALLELESQFATPGVPARKANPTRSGSETRQPLIIETSNVSYDPGRTTIETPGAVQFRLGAATGSAVGLAYNTRSGGLTLRRNVSLSIPRLRRVGAKAADEGAIRMSAGGLIYSKRASLVRLDSPVNLTQPGRKLEAAGGELHLDSQNRITRVDLSGVRADGLLASGEVKGFADHFDADLDPATNRVLSLSAGGRVEIEDRQSHGGGWRRDLTADRMTVAMAGVRITPHAVLRSKPASAVAQGHVKLVFDPAQGSERAEPASGGALRVAPGERILTAPQVAFTFARGGALKEAHTVGRGVLQLIPSDRSLDRQTLTAGQLAVAFDPAGRIETLQGVSSTRVVDQPSPLAGGRPARIASADDLTARIDPKTGVLSSIHQKGHCKFEEGARHAVADEALYDARKQELALSGNPEVWNPQGRLRARHMLINLGTGQALGWGNVQSVYYDRPTKGTGRPTSPGLAVMVQDRTPVIVLADRVTMNKARQTARYEGNVRAWRGPDVVETPSLEIDRKQERLSSGRGVVTSLLQPGVPAGKAARGQPKQKAVPQPVTISADHLDYFNARREAVYAGNVRMVSANTTFQSDRLEVYFSAAFGTPGSGSPEIERATAEGNVRVTQPPGRRATAQRAEYDASAGKIVLTGGPPAVYDQQLGYLTGKRLTFFIHDASLLADGGKKAQTESRRRILKR